MKTVVADASFCGAWILQDEASQEADELLAEVEKGSTELLLPALWPYEMLNLLRSALRRQRLNQTSVNEAMDLLGHIPTRNIDLPDSRAMQVIMDLSIRHDLSAYDASYLELALRFNTILKSNDRSLKAAAKSEGLSL